MDFISIDITPKMAKKLTCCIPQYHRSSEIILYLKSNVCDGSKRNICTPFPVRGEVDPSRNQITALNETFGDIARDPVAVIPNGLKPICLGKQYVDGQVVVQEAAEFDEPNTKEQADSFVEKVTARFIKSIAVSSNGSYMLITQAEAYLINTPSSDDCVKSTITLGFPKNLVFVVEQKKE